MATIAGPAPIIQIKRGRNIGNRKMRTQLTVFISSSLVQAFKFSKMMVHRLHEVFPGGRRIRYGKERAKERATTRTGFRMKEAGTRGEQDGRLRRQGDECVEERLNHRWRVLARNTTRTPTDSVGSILADVPKSKR